MTKEYTFRIYQITDGNNNTVFRAKSRNRFGFWTWVKITRLSKIYYEYYDSLLMTRSREELINELQTVANQWAKREYLKIYNENTLKIKITLIETTNIKGEYHKT